MCAKCNALSGGGNQAANLIKLLQQASGGGQNAPQQSGVPQISNPFQNLK
ncbi:MAG: hypothetical protein KC476_07780 [Cyanobacteria bacterium HKST-UBA06]|nr:hypothetical protein [Cyanobacteria bacterium HKST-UBA05]MCA9798756.1 hypothetical protein [Cyanobacteria bacterium HKST-UBA04]MCA9807839.1 hypothetical protein [Cyanobacteria bacterium HKST-UBA06]MCA9842662.1 hypothetical protein [Cyanobacteria bacterium HKST-UBA03]